MSSSRPRYLVAHLGTELYGSDRMLLESVVGLVESGAEVVVTLPGEGPLADRIRAVGARIAVAPTLTVRREHLKPGKLLTLMREGMRGASGMRGVLRDVRPDAVYINTVAMPLWPLMARMRRIPSVVHVHEAESSSGRMVRRLLYLPLRAADRVVVNSEFTRSAIGDVHPAVAARSTLVVNGVPGPAHATAARERLDGALRLLYVGRLSARKAPDVIIEALPKLRQHGLDATLDLVGAVFPGNEAYEGGLRARIAELGLEAAVRFRGFRDDVWQPLADADILIVPSRLDESFGNTAAEGLMAGRPTIVSSVGGLPDVVRGFASASAVEPDDVDALEAAIERTAHEWQAIRSLATQDAARAEQRFAPARYRREIAETVRALVPATSTSTGGVRTRSRFRPLRLRVRAASGSPPR